MSKVRVFQFPFASANSGKKHYVMNNWKWIDKDRFYFDFATVRKHLDFENEIFETGAGVKYISCTAENDRNRFIEELSEIFYGNYDVVHLHTSFWKSFLVEQIAIDCKIPKIIVHSHSTRIDLVDDAKRIEAEKIHNIRKAEFNPSLATDLCACSKAAADWLFGEHIPRENIRIMKNAIDADKFIYNKDVRERYRSELGLDGCFVIGHVGRFSYTKNHEFLLNVFAETANKIPDARLLLIGDGPLKDDIEKQAEMLRIRDKVILTGARDDVNDLLQAMDVFCLPSRFEGLGIVLVEALCAGLKCIASDVVPEEINISDNICFLPLSLIEWTNRIADISKGYDRRNMHDIITDAGYNIRYQIKEVEKLYLE